MSSDGVFYLQKQKGGKNKNAQINVYTRTNVCTDMFGICNKTLGIKLF